MTTPQGLAVSAAHDAAQARLLDRGLAEITLAQSTLFDINDLDNATRYVEVAADLVRVNRAKAVSVAGDFYNVLRMVETAREANVPAYVAVPAPPVEPALLRASMAVTGPVTAKAALARGLTSGEAAQRALTATLGAVTRHLEGGPRDVTLLNSRRDPASKGWSRQSGGRPCAFCAMLISRGPVYSRDSVTFRAHDHCHCKAVAFFGRDSGWTQQSREFESLWRESDGTIAGFRKTHSEAFPKPATEAAVPLPLAA